MVKLGCCGDNCDFCPRYIATIRGDKDELKEVAILWKKLGFRDTLEEPESLICYGCHFSKECAYLDVKKCCLEKKIENCGKCSSYICEKISLVFKNTKILTEKCKELLSDDEFDVLSRAFFQKQENLDKEKSLNSL